MCLDNKSIFKGNILPNIVIRYPLRPRIALHASTSCIDAQLLLLLALRPLSAAYHWQHAA